MTVDLDEAQATDKKSLKGKTPDMFIILLSGYKLQCWNEEAMTLTNPNMNMETSAQSLRPLCLISFQAHVHIQTQPGEQRCGHFAHN